jgi:Icc-related predicted phosphoesterase
MPRDFLRHSLKILAITDIHGSEQAMAGVRKLIRSLKPDLLVVCGDITNFGPPGLAKEFLDSIDIPTFAIPGNCDPPEVITAIEESKAETLHRREVDYQGEHFVGLGGSPRTPYGTPTEFSEERIFEFLDDIMVERSILITHAPPWGKNDKARGTHLGSSAIQTIVEKYKPKLAISGHIHEARGVIEEGGTTFVNPGPASHGYAALIKIRGNRVKVELLEGMG